MPLQRKTIISTKVINILKKSMAPMSIPQIQDVLSSQELNPNKSTLYRLMEKLVAKDYLTAIVFSNQKTYYEINNHNHHHHHFFCTSCENIVCLSSCQLNVSQFNEMVPETLGKVSSHDFNLYGKCTSCSD